MGSLEGNEGFGRGDYFLVGYDFPAYIECQEKVDIAYRNQEVKFPLLGQEAQLTQLFLFVGVDKVLHPEHGWIGKVQQ